MRYQKHCPGCFRRKDGVAVCPHCNYDEAAPRGPLFLPHGTVLGGQYRVGRVLGRPGGFGITYLGWDIYLQQRVAIKEYLPPEIAARIPHSLGITVHTRDYRKNFETGKEQFLREARLVAQLNHPNVVRVRGFFNANDTAYLIMDYYDGMTLESYFEHINNVIEVDIAVSLMLLVLDGLAYVHSRGVVHRDIKPNNIYLASVGRPILLDFGAARQSMETQLRSVSVVFTEGYAPLEQYQRRGVQGPWTDVYGAAATLYRMIAGLAPPVPMDRAGDRNTGEPGASPVASLHEALRRVPEQLHAVFERALALKPEDRFPSATEFQAALNQATSSVPVAEAEAQSVVASAAFITEANAQRGQTDPLPPPLPATTPATQVASAVGEAPGAAEAAAAAVVPTSTNTPVTGPLEADVRPPEGPATPRRNARWMGLGGLLLLALAGFAYRSLSDHRETSGTNGAAAVAPLPRGTPADLLAQATAPDMAAIGDAVFITEENGAASISGIVRENRLRPYRIALTEVTIGQFRKFVVASGYHGAAWDQHACEGAPAGGGWDRPGYALGEEQPVTCVDWHDAQAYALWLGQQTGRGFRLASEGEWDYAARQRVRTRFWWGNDYSTGHAACTDCADAAEHAPHEVRRFPANALGLYGTVDNVAEWTCSRYEDPESIAATGCLDAGDGGLVAVRGGSWHDTQDRLRSDERSSLDVSARNSWTGFRLAETLPDNR